MIERQKVQQLNDILYPSKVTCNMCANTIWDAKTAMRDRAGLPVAWDTPYFKVNHEWGYGSQADGESHSFELCIKCYDDLTKSFKIPITVVQLTEC